MRATHAPAFVIVAAAACGRVNFDTVVDAQADVPADVVTTTLPCTTPFASPVLISELTSPVLLEICPELRDDGLELIWHDLDPAGLGGTDVWTAVRASTQDLFGPRALLANINTTFNEGGASLSLEGLEVYFSSDRAGGNLGQIYVARRPTPAGAFGPSQRIDVLSSLGYDQSPSLSPDGLTLYFDSDRPGGAGLYDLWFTTRATPTTPFGPAQNLIELNTAVNENTPSITADGLALFYDVSSTTTKADIWVATRATTADPFSPGSPVAELDLIGSVDTSPSISASGERITFSSDRLGGAMDMYVATRVCP
jgi:Tol biopolymer transport system component